MSAEAKKVDIALRLRVVQEGLWPSCLNCVHWHQLTTIKDSTKTVVHRCSRYDMIPPNETIVVGCIKHESHIPF